MSYSLLLLVDTGQPGGLTLCPSDVVTIPGASVLMRAAGKPGGSLLRWRRKRSNSASVVIFTGVKMDYTQVDERYFVAGSLDEERSLVIRDVKSTDAGEFSVREEFSRQSASFNLVVIGKLSQLALC